MDNPARTAAHFARVEAQRHELQGQLASLLSHGSFVWEIGCGHGHFLTAYASAHPDRLCVGIDLSGERIGRAQRKRTRARLANLHFLQTEARLFLEALPSTAKCCAIFVLFPDPWPKLRHHKHRILQSSFLTAAAACAAPECRVYFRTDYEPYFVATRETIDAHPCWTLADEPWPFEFETVFQSRAARHHSLIARRRQ